MTTAADRRGPYVVAHRGLSSSDADNTLDAFERAIGVGADMVEFDVRRTADDELIAFHDHQVGSRPVSQMTRGEIEASTGVAPPLVSEILELTRKRVKLDVELKEPGYVARVVEMLRTHHGEMDEIVVTSFLDGVVREVKLMAPEISCGLLLGVASPKHLLRTRLSELFPVKRARRCHADFLAPHMELARLGVLARGQAAGLRSYVWTVNDPSEIGRFVADPRVAALITDDPSLAIELREKGAA